MGRLLLTNCSDERTLELLRGKEEILRKLGIRILENGNPVRAEEVYVGSKIELESPQFRNTSIPSIVHIPLETTLEEDPKFMELLTKLSPLVSYEYTPYGSLWLKAEKLADGFSLVCPLCDVKLDFVISHAGDLYPSRCACGADIAFDVSDGNTFSVLGVADLGVRGEIVKVGLVEYAAVRVEDIPNDLRQRLINVLQTPDDVYMEGDEEGLDIPPYPDDTLYDAVEHFSLDRTVGKKEDVSKSAPLSENPELCIVFYRKDSEKESLLITESASPTAVRKIRAVFHRLKEKYSILVNGKEADSPSQIVPGVKIELASEELIPHGDGAVIMQLLDKVFDKDPLTLLTPLIEIDTKTDGYILLKKAKIQEISLKCPFCGKEDTYLYTVENEKVFPSSCDCGAAVYSLKHLTLPETTEEDLNKRIEKLFHKLNKGELPTPDEIAMLKQLETGYTVERKVIEDTDWLKSKKITKKARNLPYPCLTSIIVPATVWYADLQDCWIAFEMEDVDFEPVDFDGLFSELEESDD